MLKQTHGVKLRVRKMHVAKWVLTALAVLLAAIWIGSIWGTVQCNGMDGTWLAAINSGQFGLQWSEEVHLPPIPVAHYVAWQSPSMHWGFTKVVASPGSWVEVPLWPLVLFVAIATALLWKWDRDLQRQGMCRKCGYNLAGIAKGAKCPECGAASGIAVK